MRTVTVYKSDGTKIECRRGEVSSRKDYDVDSQGTMSEKVLKGYYALECEKGSRFNSGYSKNQIKTVHERNIAWKQLHPD